jgi:hypothetical protein
MPVGLTPLQATYFRSASGLPGVTLNVTGAGDGEALHCFCSRDGDESSELTGGSADADGNCDIDVTFPTSFFTDDVAVCFWHVTGEDGFDDQSPSFAVALAAAGGGGRGAGALLAAAVI